ncbi:TOBE domain-containing protein [Agrobacterium sp. ES01]|uniref:TOBE domain-containing protein n=1 Tax=Agrobacterium sp. ES01 TaxID=3420714 RepID=UPI003D1041FA
MNATSLRPALDFHGANGHRAGADRFALLDAIDETGSISAAAKQVGLSYRGAWDAVNALNNLFPRPIVTARPGGKQGGGAEVTEEGRQALSLHRRLTASIAEILSSVEAGLAAGAIPQSLIWSPMMKTSARNTFHGVVTAVEHGAVNAEVLLKISPDVTMAVILTEKSLTELKIEPGVEAYALIKASTPILMADDGTLRTSARNSIAGTVISVEPGAVNTEVVMDIGEGKTLCAIVTDDSADAMGIRPGNRMRALIKASQIILALA